MDRLKTMERLKKRADFLAAAGGARVSRRGFVVQKRDRNEAGAEAAVRIGFTVTKKMGNSPERNRIRRRLREAVRLAAQPHAAPGSDYVLIGRRAALSQPFEHLVADLISGLGAVAEQPSAGARRPEGRRGKAPAKAKKHSAPYQTLNDPARAPGSLDLTPKDPRDER